MTLKIAHISDLHIGYRAGLKENSSHINLREADGYVALAKLVKSIIQEGVDSVVVAGDVFHTPTPSVRSIVFVQNQFRKFWDAGIKVYALAGNHDANDIRGDIAASRVLHDPWREIYSHVEPYVKYEISDGVFLHLVSHHMYSEQKATMESIEPVEGSINIFSTHGSCIDPLLNEQLKTEQSPREIVIPDFLLKDKDWSYSMLGHIHERGWVGSKDKTTDTENRKIFYNGSLIRRGFSDNEVPLGRGWTLWEIDDYGIFTSTVKTIPQRPQYDFEVIDASDHSASEITDIIVENLKKTQLEGQESFDGKTAPILRQKIVNLTPSKQSGMDSKVIDSNTWHALTWKLDRQWSLKELPKTVGEKDDQKVIAQDLSTSYESWVKESETYKNLETDMQEKVFNQTKEFVELGQEKLLEMED